MFTQQVGIFLNYLIIYYINKEEPFQNTEICDGIKVFIRIKPQLENQQQDNNKVCIKKQQDRTLVINANDNLHQFTFDYILDKNCEQLETFYITCQPVLDHVIEGYNGSFLVYGQTGTGKTHTMGLLSKITSEQQGIVSLSIKYLFDQLQKRNIQDGDWKISISFLQIYIEDIQDLLNPDGKKLLIREDTENNEIYVDKLVTVPIQNYEQAIQLINAGLNLRKMGSQNMNQTSSRSHTILTVYLTKKINDDNYIFSNMTFIDLAGSERIKKSQSTGIKLEEAKSINTSLCSLSNVISALSTGKPGKHIPYRSSKLTRILQNSMNSRSKIVIIGTINSGEDNQHETYSTLLFCSRCKEIQYLPPQSANQVFQLEYNQDNLVDDLKEQIKSAKIKEKQYEEKIELQQNTINQLTLNENETKPKYLATLGQFIELTEYLVKVLAKLNIVMNEKYQSAKLYIPQLIEETKSQQINMKDQNESFKLQALIKNLNDLDKIYQLKTLSLENISYFENITFSERDPQQQIVGQIQEIAKITVDNVKKISEAIANQEKVKIELALDKITRLQEDSKLNMWAEIVGYLISFSVNNIVNTNNQQIQQQKDKLMHLLSDKIQQILESYNNVDFNKFQQLIKEQLQINQQQNLDNSIQQTLEFLRKEAIIQKSPKKAVYNQEKQLDNNLKIFNKIIFAAEASKQKDNNSSLFQQQQQPDNLQNDRLLINNQADLENLQDPNDLVKQLLRAKRQRRQSEESQDQSKNMSIGSSNKIGITPNNDAILAEKPPLQNQIKRKNDRTPSPMIFDNNLTNLSIIEKKTISQSDSKEEEHFFDKENREKLKEQVKQFHEKRQQKSGSNLQVLINRQDEQQNRPARVGSIEISQSDLNQDDHIDLESQQDYNIYQKDNLSSSNQQRYTPILFPINKQQLN